MVCLKVLFSDDVLSLSTGFLYVMIYCFTIWMNIQVFSAGSVIFPAKSRLSCG